MTTYFTPMTRAGNGINREVYIEEFIAINPFRHIHDLFGLVFVSRMDAEKKAMAIISSQGGVFIGVMPPRGRKRGKYKPRKSEDNLAIDSEITNN